MKIGLYKMYLLVFCLLHFGLIAGVQAEDKKPDVPVEWTADGPYLLHQADGTVRMIVVKPNGELLDTLYSSLPDNYTFPVVSSDQQHRFDVTLHPEERPEWKTEQPDKIFVTSDPHGNLDCFISLLQGNRVIDENYHWNFGSNQLVIIGDVFDRGNDAIQIFWLIYQLEWEARQAGGRVDFLLGNHEPMVLMNDLRYTKPKYKQLAEKVGMKYADLLASSTELGKWLTTRNTIQVSGGNLFVHAGLSRDFLEQNLEIPFVNKQMSSGLYKNKAQRKEASPMIYFLFGSYGPIWYRGMVKQAEKYHPLASDTLNLILDRYQAERVIVGHTIFEDISTFYDQRVIAVNVDNAENREKGKGRGILIEKDCIYVVGDQGILRKLD